MPKLYTFNISHFSEKARWTLDYEGIPYAARQGEGIAGGICAAFYSLCVANAYPTPASRSPRTTRPPWNQLLPLHLETSDYFLPFSFKLTVRNEAFLSELFEVLDALRSRSTTLSLGGRSARHSSDQRWVRDYFVNGLVECSLSKVREMINVSKNASANSRFTVV